jgi:hypothetical protein
MGQNEVTPSLFAPAQLWRFSWQGQPPLRRGGARAPKKLCAEACPEMCFVRPQKEMHWNKQREQLQHVLEQLHELQEEVPLSVSLCLSLSPARSLSLCL